MTKKYEVGGKLRYLGGGLGDKFTRDKLYPILSVNMYDVSTEDDLGVYVNISYTYLRKYYELVDEEIPVEASQSVIELLANISRRLYEAEQTIKSQAYEINELYKAVADRG